MRFGIGRHCTVALFSLVKDQQAAPFMQAEAQNSVCVSTAAALFLWSLLKSNTLAL
jgi:hypothetical protein